MPCGEPRNRGAERHHIFYSRTGETKDRWTLSPSVKRPNNLPPNRSRERSQPERRPKQLVKSEGQIKLPIRTKLWTSA